VAAHQGETRGWARRLAGYAWRYPKDVVLALGSSLAGMALMALVPLITKVIIDDVIGNHSRSMAPWAGALIGTAVLVYVLAYIRRYYGGRLALDVQHDLRTEMYGTITRLDGRRQDELSTGQVVGRATSDLQLIQGLLFMLPMTIGNVLLFLVSLMVMAWLSLPLTLVALAVAPAAVVPPDPSCTPSCLVSISAKKSSEGTSIRRSSTDTGGEETIASWRAPAGGGAAVCEARTCTWRARRVRASWRAANAAGDRRPVVAPWS
jgi:ABC-type multidrug transport system fused ATPase/permease subunit